MGRQLLLGASRHADGREMKVSLSQAFRVLEVEVTFKTCVTDEARTAGNRLPRLLLFHQINLLLTNNTATSPCSFCLGQ